MISGIVVLVPNHRHRAHYGQLARHLEQRSRAHSYLITMTDISRSKCILIAGPTASGKSALALDLAREFGGVIINADSMQVYRELRILTNRPSEADEARAAHAMYGFRPMAQPYSVALWLEDAGRALAAAASRGLVPIVTGGTGLYFKALTEGLSPIPPVSEAVREKWRHEQGVRSSESLHAQLAKLDPRTAAGLRSSDPQRIVRALEVFETTGIPLAQWRETRTAPLIDPGIAMRLALLPDRARLYARCDSRFDSMIADGAAAEAAAILKLGLNPALPAMRAVGLPPLLEFLKGGISLPEAIALGKIGTRHYVKRQLTWMRNNFITWKLNDAQYFERTKADIGNYLRKGIDGPISNG